MKHKLILLIVSVLFINLAGIAQSTLKHYSGPFGQRTAKYSYRDKPEDGEIFEGNVCFAFGSSCSEKSQIQESSKGRTTSVKPDSHGDPDEVYVEVEEHARFPGGQAALMKWMSDNLHYPKSAKKSKIQGRVVLRFIIEKDGSISSIRIAKGVNKDLDKEAIQLVKKMPRWIPARVHGEDVRSYFALPVTFKLENKKEKKNEK